MSQRIENLIDTFEEAVASVGHPYHEAALELLFAFEQMAFTKGKERHANDLPFTEQKMQRIADAQGTTAGLTYQISKKAVEADRLPPEKAIQERYGAIVYAVGANIWAKRNLITQTAPEETQTDKEQVDSAEDSAEGGMKPLSVQPIISECTWCSSTPTVYRVAPSSGPVYLEHECHALQCSHTAPSIPDLVKWWDQQLEASDGEEQPERGEHGPVEVEQADETGKNQETSQAPEESESLEKYDPADFLKYDLEREQYLISHVQGALENGDPLEDAITRACRAVVESVRREHVTKPVAKAPFVLPEGEQREQDRADHDLENWHPCKAGGARCCNCSQKPRIYEYRGTHEPPYPYRIQHTDPTCPARYQLDHYDTHLHACLQEWRYHNKRNKSR